METRQRLLLSNAIAAARRAPFWRDRLAADSLPITDKAAWREAPETDRRTIAPPRGARTVYTSGTTGDRIEVLYPPRGAWFQGVLQLRMSHHQGLFPWDRSASVEVRRAVEGHGFAGLVRDRLLVPVPADAPISEVLRIIGRARPKAIVGHSQVLIEMGEKLAYRYKPAVIITHGDTLTIDHRAMLRDLFGVDPIDIYGTTECGVVGW
ncbi:MAG TPA: hypothetical protein VMR97_05690, partial [Acidimicrobiales bacterium]|nr:hypothetical protein [Acidimicrobiales bacterium]